MKIKIRNFKKHQTVVALLVVSILSIGCSAQTGQNTTSAKDSRQQQEEKSKAEVVSSSDATAPSDATASSDAVTGLQDEDSNPAIVKKTDVVIQGRTYRYIEYETIRPGVIRLNYIVPQDEVLVVPSTLDGCSVEELGKDPESSMKEKYVNITRGQKVKKVVIGGGVRSIRQNAFCNMDVSEVVLPKSLKQIEEFAFDGYGNGYCKIQKINLDWVEKIGFGAFLGCRNLKKIRLRNEKVVVEPDAFSFCSRLTEIELPKTLKGRLEACFDETGVKKIRWPRITGRVKKHIGEGLFSRCKNLKKVEFPKNQKHIYIPEGTFDGCKKLHKLVIPKGTGMVTYGSHHCADNYANSVTTLEFLGADTKVRGERYWGKKEKAKYDFITIKKIIAPKNSKAARYARKAKCIKKFTRFQLRDLKRDYSHRSYYPGNAKTVKSTTGSVSERKLFTMGKVKLVERKY